MKVRKFMLLALILILFSLGFSSIAVAAPEDGQNGRPIEVVVVVHYPHQPDRVFSGIEGGTLTEQIGFTYDGTHWENPSVGYYINLGNQAPSFETGVKDSFKAWNEVSTSFEATYIGATKSAPGSLQAKWNRRTGSYTGAKNVVGWKNLRQYPNAIGITYYWRIPSDDGYHLIETDVALNTSIIYKWWQTTVADDPDNNTWPTSQISPAYDVDVQNIMTHEAGHWLMLGDLYGDADSEQTMYGYADEYELQKRSLEAGDIAGIQEIY